MVILRMSDALGGAVMALTLKSTGSAAQRTNRVDADPQMRFLNVSPVV
jgi:hypothetical protein